MGWPQPGLLSLEALLRPLSPNRPIPGVPGPYALGTPQPGRDGDIVLVATSPTGRVELHVLDRGRWLDAAHTPSSDVAYEVLATSAPRTEAQAVTDAVAAAIERNDPGGLHVVEGSIWRRSTGVERILDPLRGYSSEVVWRRTLRLNSLTVLISPRAASTAARFASGSAVRPPSSGGSCSIASRRDGPLPCRT